MAATTIPKSRLIKLIIDELKASDNASSYFHVQSDTSIEDRLTSFSKGNLLEFVLSLGTKGKNAIRNLETAFPLRRPPTLYLAVIQDRPGKDIFNKLLVNANKYQGEKKGMAFDDTALVRFIFLPQSGINDIQINKLSITEIQLQYQYRIEYIESNEKSENYGQLTYLYSLETAIVWIPKEKHYHAIIACCDYPALRRIRDFLSIRLGIYLNPPMLNKEMIERITNGASPRSVTYSLRFFEDDSPDIQNVTISDPLMQEKQQFKDLITNPNREQVSGFYTGHPGLSLGGLGVARRDGKIWTPRRLDHTEILGLSLAIIKQTEDELSKTNDYQALARYFYHSQVRIGDKVLTGEARNTWEKLLPFVLTAQKNKKTEIPQTLLNNLIIHQSALNLLIAVQYDCPNCGVRWLAKCPACHENLNLVYEDRITAKCQKCKTSYDDQIQCVDCGSVLDVTDFSVLTRIVADADFIKSIESAAKTLGEKFTGGFGIQGLTLVHILPRNKLNYRILTLGDFKLWKTRAKFGKRKSGLLSDEKTLKVLNKTFEKCKRNGTKASKEKCSECLLNPIDPNWITNGDTCLLRLFGLPIDEKFDGIHHGHEVADIRYGDIFLATGQKLKLGIHVKSRHSNCPPMGLGRTNTSIKGLYTQVVYSAYQAAIEGQDIQVIGIAVPNPIKDDVISSLAYAVNTLGFSFLVIDENPWKEIIKGAYEQAVFDKKVS